MKMNIAGSKKPIKTALIVLAAIILLYAAVSMVFIKVLYGKSFPRFTQPEYSGYIRYKDVSGYPRTAVNFTSGKNTLSGYIYGEENIKGLVVMSHGQGYGAEDYLAQTLYFVDHGWRVLAFDNTGTYASEGKNAVGLSQSMIDLDAALYYVESNPTLSGLPLMLFGHSWGGYAVTAILNSDHPVRAAVSVSGYNAPMGKIAEELRSQLGVFAPLEYPFGWLYQTLLFGSRAHITASDGINRSNIPVMVIHGSADQDVLYDGSSIIAMKDAITNPYVVYETVSAENRNDHRRLFKSEAALEYSATKNQEYQLLVDQYQGNIPEEARAAFFGGVDRMRTSELDADLMNQINAFYESALGTAR